MFTCDHIGFEVKDLLRLRELRKSRNINQQKLAMELNTTQAAISKYELGLTEPDIAMLMKLAGYFNVSVDYLIGFSDNPFNFAPDDMNEDEIDVVKNFHRLNKNQKSLARAYIQGLLQE